MKPFVTLLSAGLFVSTCALAVRPARAAPPGDGQSSSHSHARDDQDRGNEVTPGCEKIYNAITKVPGATLYDKLGKAMTDGIALQKGLPLRQWGAIVDRYGIVCAVVTSGGPGNTDLNAQWLGSRVIAAQKANTVNAFSTNSLALSTANLYAASQPGGSLYGLQFSNPVSTAAAYGDNRNCASVGCDETSVPRYGWRDDPLVGHYVGGVNVFGGGLALYDASGQLIGGLGTSGNTSCADHYISWVVRHTLGLDYVPTMITGRDDNIIFPTGAGARPTGFEQPLCGIDPDEPNYPAELEKHYMPK